MKRLLFLLAGLLPAALSAQTYPWANMANYWGRPDGGPAVTLVDYSTSQTWPSALLPPCGASGAPVWRAFCDGDGVILQQGVTPGTQQASTNFNISGKAIAGNFEVPSNGKFCGTSLSCILIPSTNGRIIFQKNTADGSISLYLGDSANTSGAIGASATQMLVSTGAGLAFPFRATQFLIGRSPDTAATVALATAAAPFSSSFRACDATSNTVAYTLPAALDVGAFFYIYKVDATANLCTITVTGSNRIQGLSTITLTNPGDYVVLRESTNGFNQVAWNLVGGNQFGQPYATGTGENCTVNQVATTGGQWMQCFMSESLTLATGSVTTDSSQNLLPANSIIDAVTTRVTTNITTAVSFSVGDSIGPTTARFSASAGGMSSGSTRVGLDQWNPAGAAAANGPANPTAGKVRITTNANPGAGVIKITTYYRRFVAPTS